MQVRTYGDEAIFVHIYGPEPHPTLPDTNFDAGKQLPNYWSLTRQHTTYKERLAAAKAIRPFTHPDQVKKQNDRVLRTKTVTTCSISICMRTTAAYCCPHTARLY